MQSMKKPDLTSSAFSDMIKNKYIGNRIHCQLYKMQILYNWGK